jgi:multisubunit Na+/H+ antiporter MnhB subunit
VVCAIIVVVAARVLGPALLLAAALIVKGYADVGDGFSAAVIVSLAIALRYLTLGPDRTERSLPILRHAPAVAASGLLVALGVGFAGVAFGYPPFTMFPRPGEPVVTIGTLELISAVGFDVGLFLLVTGVMTVMIHHLTRLAAGSDT